MVNVSIIGAESPLSGEIIRILLQHPETEFSNLFSPALQGRNVAGIHHGLIGEAQLNFTDKISAENSDVIIISESAAENLFPLDQLIHNKDLKFISLLPLSLDSDFEVTDHDADNIFVSNKDVNNIEIDDIKENNSDENKTGEKNSVENKIEIGLSEINRKPLVRGARIAVIPSPLLVGTLIALSPLADYMLLNKNIEIDLEAPADILKSSSLNELNKTLHDYLKTRQPSFKSGIHISLKEIPNSERSIITKIKLSNTLPLEEIEKIYDSIYDDHNFTFLSRQEVNIEEVEGTQKVVMHLEKPTAEELVIEVASDGRLRGGAGDVVHVINLFFGLHEKTGLYLKPSRFLTR